MRFIATYALLMTSAAFASGNGAHHGSASDLIAPAVNVAILVGFLVWKLKKPLNDMFTKKSEEITNTIERASLKSKEAQMMLENEQRKITNLSSEMKNLADQSESDVKTFEKNLSKETEDKIQKLKTDASSKIAADKKSIMDELNTELLNQVIAKTKTTIKTNKDFQSKASNKLLQGLK
ncbi:MAG: ATP synthase F0 subunit B [Bdellovibrionota bacterium]